MHQGSTWNIWDFHLHTPYSILNNQYGSPEDDETWDRYITAIEETASEKGIIAIGITDYFTIDGYKRVLQYQEEGRLKNLLIFPNVEFRVDKIIYRSRGGADPKRLNFHVLFSPELSINHIEEHFLHDLDFTHEQNPFDREHRCKLKAQNLKEFGETLQEQEEKFRGKSPLVVGSMNAIVNVDKIKERLEEDGRFHGKYLLVLANEDLSFIEWGKQDHATRQQLIQMSHAIFSSNPNDREFCLGKKHESQDIFVREFKSLKPCVWGCDSHGFKERFLEPDDDRYCWIKSEVSWEGLKQILYEPEDRILVQKDDPEPSKSFFTLDSVQVKGTQVNDALRIDDLEIKLNPNLVAIIGGRGSGKTALLDLIAACFPEGGKLADIKNSFYYRLYAPNGTHAAPAPISLRFRSGDEFSKEVGQEDTVFEHADLLYLTQNHMDEYTANPAKLYKHIVDIVFDQDPDQRHGYDELREQNLEIQQDIELLNLKIAQLRKEIENNLSKEQTDLSQKAGQLADYRNRLHEQEIQQADSGKETEKLTESLKSLKAHRDRIIALRDRLDKILAIVSQFHSQYKIDVQTINDQLTELTELSSLIPLPVEISQLETVSQTLSTNIDVLQLAQPNTEKQIAGVEKELGELEGIDSVIAQLRRTFDRITSEIETINKRIQELQEKEKQIVTLDLQRVEKYAATMRKIVEQRLYLQRIINQFESEQNDLLSGLSFAALVDTSIGNDYIDRICSKVDGRAHPCATIEHELGEIIEDVGQLLNTSPPEDVLDDSGTILPIAKRVREWAHNKRLKASATESEFFDAVLSPFFRIGLLIKFNDRSIESLSMGERAVVLLKILLGLDDKPLLIDQPEEHLDNRYIYDELMPAFRSAKTKRQIIIATHNANLVVNTDAEQIIVAEHADGTISYQVGTLEDLNVRESITTILEGGGQAFRKREERYGFKF